MAMEKFTSTVTGKTLVPISLVASLLGGTGWITQMYYTNEATAKTVHEVKIELRDLGRNFSDYKLDSQEKMFKILKEIDSRLSRIESKL